MKPVIKTKGLDCLALIFEVSENFDISIDTFLEFLKNKNVKIATSGTVAIAHMVD